MKFLIIFVLTLFLFPLNANAICFFGCVDADIDTSDIKEATQDIKESSKRLAEGLNNLDPVGLKTLLKQNASLRDSINLLSDSLSPYKITSAEIVLQGQNLKFEIPLYSGEFTINAWIDSKSNWILKDRTLTNLSHKLALDKGNDYAGRLYNKLPKELRSDKGIIRIKKKDYVRDQRSERKAYDEAMKVAQLSFIDYLKNGPRIPPNDVLKKTNAVEIDLNQSLRTVGLRRVVLEITPIGLDASSNWSLRGRLTTNAANGDIKILKTLDVSNSLYPSHKIGTSIEPIIMEFSVKAKDGNAV
jgi:hypothetical protein